MNTAAIRIELRCFKSGAHSGHGFERRAERIFVGGKFDDFVGPDSDLSSSFFNRLARFISDQVAQLAISSVPDRNHALNLDAIGVKQKAAGETPFRARRRTRPGVFFACISRSLSSKKSA